MTSAAPIEKLSVYMAHPGRSCLNGVLRPKLVWIPQDRAEPADPHVTILPASHNLDFIPRLHEIPDWAWARARTGRGKLLIDASLEGWAHTPERSRALHEVLERTGVPPSQAVYVTQDRGYGEAYRAYCRTLGIPAMPVFAFDFWLREVARQHEGRAEEEFAERLAAYRSRPRTRTRRFLSLNRSLRPTKALFLLRLLRDGLWDQGAISLGGLEGLKQRKGYSTDLALAKVFYNPDFADLNRELEPVLSRLADIGEISFQSGKAHRKFGPILDEPLAEYGQTWFSVITETEMERWPSRITEKPMKPLLNFHPLIVLGNPGSLELLRGYGFRSFEGLFDESYDAEPDPRRRFERVYGEVQRLCALDEGELDRMERALDEVLVHNARHGLVTLPGRFRRDIDPGMVAAIMAPAEQLARQARISPQSLLGARQV